MRVHLEYGRTGLDVELSDQNVRAVLGYQPAEPLAEPERAVAEVLANPTGSPSLAELARGRRDACIVVCDITRPVPNALLLEPLLATLEQNGIQRSRIRILVATGLHRPSTPEEQVEMLGAAVVDNYLVENHHGEATDEHAHLGTSPRGVPVWIDRRYVEADLKITIGLIEPHFMAGFSGGRKLICPGLASLDTIRRWHSPEFLEHPNAATGILDENPVHEENTWIARRAGCDFIVNTILDDQRRLLGLVAGDMEAAFIEGVDLVRRLVTATIESPVDIVVSSGAGYPLDATYYQSIKGMVAALPILKPGGTIILAAGMTEGIGSEPFCALFDENASIDIFMDRILSTDYFRIDQWQLEEFAKALRAAKIRVVTDGLPSETLSRLYVDPSPSVEQAVAEALADHGPNATIAVIPKGPYVMARLAP